MFDLEKSILNWRRQMLAGGVTSPVPLEELELHLREDIAGQVSTGTNEQAAFENAARQLGQAAALKHEFANARETLPGRLKKLLFSLIQIPNLQPITNMNTSDSNSEGRWATYARAGAFVFPALFLWLFTVVFVLPKVNELCQAAGTTVFNFANTPLVFRASALVGQGMILLTNHGLLICGVVILACFLLERYFQPWPRYRRFALGLGAYLFNGVVLLSLTMMIISIILVAPYLMHHAR